MNAGAGMLQDAAVAAKMKMNPFMHTPEVIARLNNALRSGKKNLHKMRDGIKELRAEGKEGTPEYSDLISKRKAAASVFRDNLRELRKEQMLGDIPLDRVVDEVETVGIEAGRKAGYGPRQTAASASTARAILMDQLEAADIDPTKINLRQAQDQLHRYADSTRDARYAKADAKRSGFGKAVVGAVRKAYDPGMSSGEVSSRLIGQMQLDDVYDPLAKMRSSADGLFSSNATNTLAAAGRIAHKPAEALEDRFGQKIKDLAVSAREGLLEFDPTEIPSTIGKKLKSVSDAQAGIPALPAPAATPVPTNRRNLTKMRKKNRTRKRKR